MKPKKLKKTVMLLSACIFSVTVNQAFSQAIAVNSAGRVGINGAPDASTTYPLRVNGSVKTTSDLYVYDDIILGDQLYGSGTSLSSINNITHVSSYLNGFMNLSATSTLKVTGGEATTNTLLLEQGKSAYALRVNGHSYFSDQPSWPSDKSLKKNIHPLDGTSILDRIAKIEAKKYNYKNVDELKSLHKSKKVTFRIDTIDISGEAEIMYHQLKGKNREKYAHMEELNGDEKTSAITKEFFETVKKNHEFDEVINGNLGIKIAVPQLNDSEETFGLIAQEVLEVFPELVKYDETMGIYTIKYVGFIPLLLEAINTQQKEIKTLSAELNEIKKSLKVKEENLTSVNANNFIPMGQEQVHQLRQNIPNPFTESTEIKYYLGEAVSKANIYIYNMSGAQLKNYEIHDRGEGSLTLLGGELTAGMYMYTMLVDGKVIDTKQMILTD